MIFNKPEVIVTPAMLDKLAVPDYLLDKPVDEPRIDVICSFCCKDNCLVCIHCLFLYVHNSLNEGNANSEIQNIENITHTEISSHVFVK